MHAAPTIELHGLHPPTGKQATRHTTNPDLTLHEAGKFAALCLAGNPTVTELLWLPDDLYEVRTPRGDHLIGIRGKFLSAKRTRDAYLGYATHQFRRLENSGRFPDVPVTRIEKHARHLLRLVEQGTNRWVTGRLALWVTDPQRVFDFGHRVGAGDVDAARWVMARAEHTFDHTPTVLPDAPDEKAVTEWLLAVRAAHYQPPPVVAPTEAPPAGRPYTPPLYAPRVVIVDVDGTVALRDPQVRGPYHEGLVSTDSPNTPVADVVTALIRDGYRPVFLSGRTEACRTDTETWLRRHLALGSVELYMRAAGDNRPDHVVKLELFDRHVRDRYDVRVVIDDRTQVIKLWRNLGLVALQVADGNF
ncbi:MAG: DNA polymerase beta superfamily protein [Pseudonocardiaceae bacterium]